MKIQATDYRRNYLHDTYLRKSLYPEYILKTHSKIKRQDLNQQLTRDYVND